MNYLCPICSGSISIFDSGKSITFVCSECDAFVCGKTKDECEGLFTNIDNARKIIPEYLCEIAESCRVSSDNSAIAVVDGKELLLIGTRYEGMYQALCGVFRGVGETVMEAIRDLYRQITSNRHSPSGLIAMAEMIAL